jgi:hypothetical protein
MSHMLVMISENGAAFPEQHTRSVISENVSFTEVKAKIQFVLGEKI